MLKNGEYYFFTFEDALEFVSKPTNYELLNAIKVVSKEVVKDYGDMKLVAFEKSDGTKSMCIFFKNSKKYDIWKFWYPSENQQASLIEVAVILNEVDKHNDKHREKP